MSLLPRFYDPSHGRILLDGRDVRSIRLRSLRDQISVVLQEPLLFSGSIRDNIRYGNLDASTDEVVAAAQAANAHDFIVELPEQYDTTIGDSIQLSPGLADGRSAYNAAYEHMEAVGEPWALGDPLDVAQAVVSAIEDVGTPLRVLLGEDAAWYIEAKSRGDDDYRRAIWELWRLPE